MSSDIGFTAFTVAKLPASANPALPKSQEMNAPMPPPLTDYVAKHKQLKKLTIEPVLDRTQAGCSEQASKSRCRKAYELFKKILCWYFLGTIVILFVTFISALILFMVNDYI